MLASDLALMLLFSCLNFSLYLDQTLKEFFFYSTLLRSMKHLQKLLNLIESEDAQHLL